MSPVTCDTLLQVQHIILACILRGKVKQTGSEDREELAADGTAMAAKVLAAAESQGKIGLCRTWVAKVEGCELGLDLLHLVKLCRVYGSRVQDVIGVME